MFSIPVAIFLAAQLKVCGTCEIIARAGGGGVSRIATRLVTFILLKNLSPNKARLERSTRCGTEPIVRAEYKLALQRAGRLSPRGQPTPIPQEPSSFRIQERIPPVGHGKCPATALVHPRSKCTRSIGAILVGSDII